MKNVSEIINQGNKNAELPAWLNMRHAWSASDAKRDEGLIYPNNVIQIKNLDYKKEPDHQKWCEAVELLASQRTMGKRHRKSIVGFSIIMNRTMLRILILNVMHQTVYLIYIIRLSRMRRHHIR